MTILNMFDDTQVRTVNNIKDATIIKVRSTYDEAWDELHRLQPSNHSYYSMYFKSLDCNTWYIINLNTVGRGIIVPCNMYDMNGNLR